jgi:hypothetical protein
MNRSTQKRKAAAFPRATSVTRNIVTFMNTRHQTGILRVMTIEQTHTLLSLVPDLGMMQNIGSRFRAGAVPDLLAIGNWKGLDCFFGKLGLAEPSYLSARAPVCRFSILAFWQECVRRHGIVGLPVRPRLCAGLKKGVPGDVRWAAAGEAGCVL